MTNCYNAGKVIATGNLAAGIVASPSTFCTFTNCFNVGSITAPSDTGGIVSSNYGIVVNSYYSSDCGGGGSGTAMPTSKFQSGEVAYRLNGSVSGGSPWRQTLSVDEYPVLDSTHGMVYYAYADCDAQTLSYCNVRHDTAGHSYDNGVCIYCGAYQAADSNASGIYEIANAGQLYWFAALVNGTLTDGTAQNRAAGGILTADITLNDETFEYMASTGLVKVTDGTNVGYVDTREGKQGDWYVDANGTTAGAYSGTLDVWTPIGDFNTSNQNIYLGAFDGAGHSISGLYTGDSAKSYQGLFGYAAYGLIERVCVSNSFLCGSQSVGGICGRSDTNIQKCFNAATVTATNDVGGVCGGLDSQTIQDCCNLGAFFGAYNYGGVCGQNKGVVKNSYHAGVIINTSAYAIKGSICSANANGTLQNCYYLGAADDSTSGTTDKSAAQFASGEVCYLLNNGVTDNTQAWYQTIGTHTVPQFEGASVYYAEHGNPQYSNNSPVYWTVQYVADGAVVATLQVLDGQSLSEIPTIPQKTGYDQTAPVWETDLSGVAITQNYTVNAKYTINTYTVTFVADGAMVAEYTVDWNATLSEIPAIPQKTGYDQTAPVWETDLFGVAITQNYTVNAKYTINTYTVTFVADGATVAEYTVDWNATLTEIPVIPNKTGYSGAWDLDLTDVAITQDYVITAVYTYIPLMGDVNLDKSVTAADAALLLRYIVGLNVLSPQALALANVNGDASITSADATTILRYVVGLPSELTQ